MAGGSIQRKFNDALAALLEQLKQDRSVLAAVLCGSLSHDTVWAGSDIDLLLVTIDDKKVPEGDRALYADGLNVHARLIPRQLFRQTVEGSVRNSFMHAVLAKSRLLYTHDPSIAELFTDLEAIGERDTELQLLAAATEALGPIYKAHKWLLTRDDLEYTALWILYAARPLARIEVLAARRIADREVIPQALKLNPALFKIIYLDLLNSRKTRRSVTAALQTIDRYLAERAPRLFAPVLAHLQEVGEARSASDLEHHFSRQHGIEGVTSACEYLADQKLLGKAGTSVQLTKRSNTSVEELAFFYVPPPQPGRRRGR
jgi:uncharacterized protein